MKFRNKGEFAHYLLDQVIERDMTFEERMRAAVLVAIYVGETIRG